MTEITVGTEKQSEWANALRSKMAAEAGEYVENMLGQLLKMVENGKRTQEQYDMAAKVYRKAVRMIANQSKAAWYINNRNSPIYKVIEDCVKVLPEAESLKAMING